MVIRHSNAYGRLTEGRLRLFEAGLGGRLPEDYRRSMLEHNGGQPKPNYFAYLHSGIESGSTLECLYAIHDRPYVDTYEGRLGESVQRAWSQHLEPDEQALMIPIGRDPYGNLVRLFYAGPDRGAVCIVDHEDPVGYFRIAESFTEFLDALHEDPDPQEPNYGECPECQANLKRWGCPECGWLMT